MRAFSWVLHFLGLTWVVGAFLRLLFFQDARLLSPREYPPEFALLYLLAAALGVAMIFAGMLIRANLRDKKTAQPSDANYY